MKRCVKYLCVLAVLGCNVVWGATPELNPVVPKASLANQKPVVPKASLANQQPVVPKATLVHPQPASKDYMRMPQAWELVMTSSQKGGYAVLLPKAFGEDVLAGLPVQGDAMLARTAAENMLCAATVLDAADVASYQTRQPLPSYEGKRVLCTWQHGPNLVWDCVLSRHQDFYGDKQVLEAQAQQNGKTYQLLYVWPADKLNTYLPQALQSMNSFQLK